MTAIIFSTISFGLAINQLMHGAETGGLIFLVSAVVWYILGIVHMTLANRTNIMRKYFSSMKEERNEFVESDKCHSEVI